MSKPTPISEFKEIVGPTDLTDEQLETFRDLIDAQANLILDSYIANKMP